MNKAILVIDMPNSCAECPLFNDFYSDMCCKGLNKRGIDYPYPKDFRQDWCPLKELPDHELLWFDSERDNYAIGFNDCLDMILNEGDNQNV